jgi:hypothetical protein
MRPDFIVKLRHLSSWTEDIFIPTHAAAQSWMMAHTEPSERGQVSAHLNPNRSAQFRSDAQLAGLTFSDVEMHRL